ncbi:MAG: hypothetical protein QS721_06950 [Candidatus Endonucleobacter sp. (ex Gigantidas childressi)]|nr:hypothetical protein [Candidatus Endonucleobacter sp. (ex Gigantidas childressi)]
MNINASTKTLTTNGEGVSAAEPVNTGIMSGRSVTPMPSGSGVLSGVASSTSGLQPSTSSSYKLGKRKASTVGENGPNNKKHKPTLEDQRNARAHLRSNPRRDKQIELLSKAIEEMLKGQSVDSQNTQALCTVRGNRTDQLRLQAMVQLLLLNVEATAKSNIANDADELAERDPSAVVVKPREAADNRVLAANMQQQLSNLNIAGVNAESCAMYLRDFVKRSSAVLPTVDGIVGSIVDNAYMNVGKAEALEIVSVVMQQFGGVINDDDESESTNAVSGCMSTIKSEPESESEDTVSVKDKGKRLAQKSSAPKSSAPKSSGPKSSEAKSSGPKISEFTNQSSTSQALAGEAPVGSTSVSRGTKLYNFFAQQSWKTDGLRAGGLALGSTAFLVVGASATSVATPLVALAGMGAGCVYGSMATYKAGSSALSSLRARFGGNAETAPNTPTGQVNSTETLVSNDGSGEETMEVSNESA